MCISKILNSSACACVRECVCARVWTAALLTMSLLLRLPGVARGSYRLSQKFLSFQKFHGLITNRVEAGGGGGDAPPQRALGAPKTQHGVYQCVAMRLGPLGTEIARGSKIARTQTYLDWWKQQEWRRGRKACLCCLLLHFLRARLTLLEPQSFSCALDLSSKRGLLLFQLCP